MQSQTLNAAIQKTLTAPAVRTAVLKQLDSDINGCEKRLAELRSVREQVVGSEDSTPAPAAPARRKAKKNGGAKKSAKSAKPAKPAKPSKKSNPATTKRGPGRPKGSKNRKSGHTKAIVEAMSVFKNGVATAQEIRETCAENGHEMASGIFHSTMTALLKQGRVEKSGQRADAIYTLVSQEPPSNESPEEEDEEEEEEEEEEDEEEDDEE